MIKDFKTGTNISNEILYCVSKKSGISIKGDEYLSVVFRDSSGTIDAKVWDINEYTSNFNEKDFVSVSGNVSTYKDSLQLVINRAEVVSKDSVFMEDFCPKCPIDIDILVNRLNVLIDDISNSNLKSLLKLIFDNEKLFTKYITNSAAKSVHHAYMGGLLEHSVTVAEVCKNMSILYPVVNKDLVVTAALLHDIGKLKELSSFPDNDYTDDGQLLGHIYMGTEMIEFYARKIDNFPRTLLNQLKHCVLAHHGKLEYGSPVVPHLIEAMLLSIADDADAKLRRFSDVLDEVEPGKWSDKNDFFLNTRYRHTII
ncbi:MAG: HD domain-containing protein [Bacilli bacterium]|nr:HD domain-containing protein [Bacilli bacterium]